MTQLKGMWSAGSLTSIALYWQEGMTEWAPLGTLIEDHIDSERKEKPIGRGEFAAIVIGSALFSVIAFWVGIIYWLRGKPRRGGWMIIASSFFSLVYVFVAAKLNS